MNASTARSIRRDRASVVLCGHPFTAFIGLVTKRMLGVPYVVWTHGKELLVWQALLRRTLPAGSRQLKRQLPHSPRMSSAGMAGIS